MARQLNINQDALVSFTNRLEKLHRSDLPIAIRNTLSRAAFETKKNSLPIAAKKAFTTRNKTFFQSKSRFERAQGFDIDKMKATVGMVDLRRSSNDHAVRNLEEQEHGGKISGRSFIPTDKARVSKNSARNVAPRNRLSRISIRDVVRASRSKGKNRHQRFVKSAIFAKKRFGSRAYVLTRSMLFRIDSLRINNRTRRLRLKITPLYSFKRGRSVNVSATNFMRKASLVQGKRFGFFFKQEAEKRIIKAKL